MEKKKTKKKAASVTPVPDAVLDATSASEPAPMHVKEKKKIKKTVSAGLEAVAAQSTESPASEAVAEKKALKKKSKSKEETPKIIAQDVVSTSAKESSDPELAADTVAKPATATASAVSIVTGVVTAPVTAAISAGNAVTGSVTNLFGSLSQAFAAFLDPELPPEEVAAAKRKLQEEVMKRQQENNAKFAAISQMIGLDATAVAATNAFSGDAPTASSKKKGLVANGVVDEDNIPLAQLQQNPASSLDKKKKKKVVLMEDSSDADSDSSGGVIVVKRVRKSKKKKSKRAGKQQVASDSDDSDSDSDSDSESESDSDRPAESPSALSRFGAAASGMASAAGFTKAASPKKGSKKSSKSASGILGKVTATFTSILEPDMTPEEKAAEKKRKAQNEALERQMANQRHFAKENKIEGLNVVDASKISLQTTTLMSSHTFKSARSEKCMPIADIPVSEEEFTRGLNYYNQRDYQWAITHWERAIKIDNNAESLRMLIELHGPSKVPNAAKVAEYTQRRRDFLQTPQGMLNHGRHLARMAGTLDGSGIVLVRSAADLGHAEACYEFGMYLRGKGKGAEAMGWLHQAADGGFIDAEEAVAEGYEKGLGGAAKDAVAGAAWRARVVARLKAKEVEELAMLAAKAEQAKELQQDAIRREKERAKLEQGIKVREENLLVRRNMDSALNGAIRNLEWGFYAAGVESLHKLAQTGNVDAHDYLDPDLSVIPAKQIVAMYHIGQYHSSQANPEGAVKWFRRSAESGYHEAQVTYAAYLIVGKGLDCADPGQAMVRDSFVCLTARG
ncbi:hypothetical protein BC830DRAFT_94209 [Chytriomyces sp. MP71]|nr:hypothetical protein BC830DRAFT_94209 [Chytriomyces sp. MP71]